jgi:hypothetical protein
MLRHTWQIAQKLASATFTHTGKFTTNQPSPLLTGFICWQRRVGKLVKHVRSLRNASQPQTRRNGVATEHADWSHFDSTSVNYCLFLTDRSFLSLPFYSSFFFFPFFIFPPCVRKSELPFARQLALSIQPDPNTCRKAVNDVGACTLRLYYFRCVAILISCDLKV